MSNRWTQTELPCPLGCPGKLLLGRTQMKGVPIYQCGECKHWFHPFSPPRYTFWQRLAAWLFGIKL